MAAGDDIESAVVDELLIDPFGAMPNWASRFSGLGGHDPAPLPGYVLRTVPVRPGLGSALFTLHFFGLEATRGTLRIEVNAVSAFPGAEPSPLDTLSLPLAELAAEKGLVEVQVMCRRNTLYDLAAEILDDSDATCAGITIAVDRRASPPERNRNRGRRIDLAPRAAQPHADSFIRSWMTRVDLPNFELPTSQGWTAEQARNPHFARLVEELGLQAQPAAEAWRQAIVMRMIEIYAAPAGHASCIGFTPAPGAVTSALAARGTDVLLIDHSEDRQRRLDPGSALERHHQPSLVGEDAFYRHVHSTHGNWWHLPASFNDRFDFLWSVNADRALTSDQFLHFILSTIACVHAGGTLIHVFDFADRAAAGVSTEVMHRSRLERLVAHALSHLNDVALLRFRQRKVAADAVRPYALLVRRGVPQ